MIKRFLFVAFLGLFLSSCQSTNYLEVPKEIQLQLKTCFDRKPTGLADRIPLKGYYTIVNERFDDYEWEAREDGFIFYEDGTVLKMTSVLDGNCRYDKLHEIARAYHISERFPTSMLNFNIYKWAAWGNYSLKGNTVSVQIVHRSRGGNFNSPARWWMETRVFEITSAGTLVEPNPTSSYHEKLRSKPSGSKFTPLEFVPKPLSYLHEKSWFRCKN